MRFTPLIAQTNLSTQLMNLFVAATRRDARIPRSGQLRDLFGAQAIFCEQGVSGQTSTGGLIRVPCIPDGKTLPPLDQATQSRITQEYQRKLLGFRFSNNGAARSTVFDSSQFAMPLRPLSASLAAATPGNIDLQRELHGLLQEENQEMSAATWVDPNTAVIEAILVHCREAKMQKRVRRRDRWRNGDEDP